MLRRQGRLAYGTGIAASRSGALVLTPSTQVAYATLQRWCGEQDHLGPIDVFGSESEHVGTLGVLLAPKIVRSAPSTRLSAHPALALLQTYKKLVNRYTYVIVLCSTDEEVTTGQTVYRILGEALMSDRLTLVGPALVRVWPGGRTRGNWQRTREVGVLVITSSMGLITAAIALSLVVLQEVVARARRVG